MRGLLAVVWFGGLFGTPVPAQSGKPSARAVMARALQHHVFGMAGAKLVVTLERKAREGESFRRRMVVQIRKRGDLIDRKICFLSPDEVKNTAFLSLGSAGRDSQFVWIPSLGRARRISTSSRSRPFLGTDFTYRDVEGRKLSDATYRIVRREKVGRHDCRVIEAMLKPEGGEEYQRIVSWIRVKDAFPLRAKLFDRTGRHIKTLFTRSISVDPTTGRTYARVVRMLDKRAGSSTLVTIESADLQSTAPAGLFTLGGLRRGLDCAP